MLDDGTHDRNVPGELADGDQEVSEQDKDAVQLNQEAGQRPAEQDQKDPEAEGGSALEFLAAGEEGDGLLEADYKD